MSSERILWLCSWYPNKTGPFHGDFIQRQARAAALYHPVHVLYIAKVTGAGFSKTTEEKKTTGNLTEHIIYNHSSSFPLLGKLFSLFRYYRLSRKYIRQYIREQGKPHIVHVQIPIKAGILALWVKRKYKIPFVLTEHYGIYNRVVVDPYEDRPFFFRYYTKRVIQEAKKFLPVSKQIGQTINQVVAPKAYQSIPNTVDTRSFFYEPVPDRRKFRFIHVSNMIPLKNVEGIINAVAQLWLKRQDFELEIIGPASHIVLEHAAKSGLLGKGLRFTGEVNYEEVANAMKKSHAMLLFSRTENMPCVVLESLCCGRPVIATNVGGIPEILDLSNGILINSDDEEGLGNAMQDMMNNYTNYDQPQIAAKAASLYSYETIGRLISDAYR
ncbi:MAG: glycosyltransferase [Chitinophagaceae bacterium]